MISYSSADTPFVDHLVERLAAHGVEPWVDREGVLPGEKWHSQLLEGLRRCDVLVPVLSEPFLDSDPCRMEVFVARSAEKRIVPIMYSPGLRYEELAKYPETKGLEDLYMFRILDEGPSQGMALRLPTDEAIERTCASILGEEKETPGRYVYIAFLSTEVDFATDIANGLQDMGVPTWIATRDIAVGKNFMQAQIKAMLGAAVVLVVLDEGIEESGYIRTELTLARAQDKKIISVLPHRYSDDPAKRSELLTRLRSRDHTYHLYEMQSYPHRGDYAGLLGQLKNDLQDLVGEGV